MSHHYNLPHYCHTILLYFSTATITAHYLEPEQIKSSNGVTGTHNFFPLLKSDVINGDDAAANGDNLLKSPLARRLRFDRHSIASLRIKNDILTVALRASVLESKSQLYQIKFP